MATITAWRIVKARYASAAFTGEGAKRDGGRWNSVGVAVVYLAESRALAIVENLVHLDADELIGHYRLLPATFDSGLVKELSTSELPMDWRRNPAPPSTSRLGDQWVRTGESAVLRVPSVIVPSESNFVLNPNHPQFHTIKLGPPEKFRFDRRLKPRP